MTFKERLEERRKAAGLRMDHGLFLSGARAALELAAETYEAADSVVPKSSVRTSHVADELRARAKEIDQ